MTDIDALIASARNAHDKFAAVSGKIGVSFSVDESLPLALASALAEQREEIARLKERIDAALDIYEIVRAERDALRARLDALAESGTGYSQQTVDAISKERDTLRARVAELERDKRDLLRE